MGREHRLLERVRDLLTLAFTAEDEVLAVQSFIRARKLNRILCAGVEDGVVQCEAVDVTEAFSRADGSAESFRARVLQNRDAVPRPLPARLPAPADLFEVPIGELDTLPIDEDEVTSSRTTRGYNLRTEWD